MAGLSREHIERAVPLGSSSYYIIRFSPAPYRNDLTHLFAWQRELTNIPLECSDPGVAKTRLQWWREEIKKSVRCQPWRAKRRLVVPGSREAALLTRRALRQRG
ncbi:MAG: squalene/phytoene synthase family protein, partial [gamma proteobacterium endosymbiont of Lamellibrachia anaximandri]|nr:squalene/phytoene synthase family protein [gamma proteobacterium endosymbiont of Lamellibrachia anaximandri]